eukprot:118921_1
MNQYSIIGCPTGMYNKFKPEKRCWGCDFAFDQTLPKYECACKNYYCSKCMKSGSCWFCIIKRMTVKPDRNGHCSCEARYDRFRLAFFSDRHGVLYCLRTNNIDKIWNESEKNTYIEFKNHDEHWKWDVKIETKTYNCNRYGINPAEHKVHIYTHGNLKVVQIFDIIPKK